MSAAIRNLDKDAREDLTRRYDALCADYGMEPTATIAALLTRTFDREPHGHFKRAVKDALLLRGTSDFADLGAYRAFIDEIISRKNARATRHIEAERAALQPLPPGRSCDYEETIVTITSSSAFVFFVIEAGKG